MPSGVSVTSIANEGTNKKAVKITFEVPEPASEEVTGSINIKVPANVLTGNTDINMENNNTITFSIPKTTTP